MGRQSSRSKVLIYRWVRRGLTNEALSEAIAGLATQDQERLKRTFGRVMGKVVEEIINPAVQAFPELEPDEGTWVAVAKARATARSNAA